MINRFKAVLEGSLDFGLLVRGKHKIFFFSEGGNHVTIINILTLNVNKNYFFIFINFLQDLKRLLLFNDPIR